LEHLQNQEGESSFDINLESPIATLQTPGKEMVQPSDFDFTPSEKPPQHL
jgi:hypothetical protein